VGKNGGGGGGGGTSRGQLRVTGNKKGIKKFGVILFKMGKGLEKKGCMRKGGKPKTIRRNGDGKRTRRG